MAGISENKDKFEKIVCAFERPLVTVTYKWHADVHAVELNMEEKWAYKK